MNSRFHFDISALKVSPGEYACPKCKDVGGFFVWDEDGYQSFKECECQVPRKIAELLKNSGVSPEMYEKFTLDSFKEDTPTAAAMKKMALEFLADKNAAGIGYFGRSGTGKTHICIAICNELTRRKLKLHRYFQYNVEMRRLKAAKYDNEEFSRIMSVFENAPILYIDDLFKCAMNPVSKSIAGEDLSIMFSLINLRYINKLRTIISSEYTVEEISRQDEALGSRLYEMIAPYGLECSGANRRLR